MPNNNLFFYFEAKIVLPAQYIGIGGSCDRWMDLLSSFHPTHTFFKENNEVSLSLLEKSRLS